MSFESLADHAFAPVRAAIDEGRIPGAALGLVAAGGGRAVRSTGHAALVPQAVALESTHWFDLASLTKVMVTTVEILRLVERGRLDLDDALSKHLPDLRRDDPDSPVRALTIRQCLAHQTFLPAWEPLYEAAEGADPVKALVLERDWPTGPPVYSDINFILLGLAIERLLDRPLRDLTVANGLSFAPDPANCVATEDCARRGGVIRGVVHDDNAWAMGGAAGHAGLFGTIDGVLDFAADLMAGRVLSAAAMAEMRRPHSDDRVLGWERRNPGWTGGSLCSPHTIGHTGFVGVGLYVDFAGGIAWALLTNRVHPSRDAETGIMDLRRSVGNRVAAGWEGSGRDG